jgi:predicted transcriptional regulator
VLLKELVEKLDLEILSGAKGEGLEAEVRLGYASDILSDVMANAPEGSVWVTMLLHQNIVAVAALRWVGAVLIVGGRRPDSETLRKADDEGVVILGTKLKAFEVAGKMFELGLRGA